MKKMEDMMLKMLEVIERMDQRLRSIEDKVDDKCYYSFSEGERAAIETLRTELEQMKGQ